MLIVPMASSDRVIGARLAKERLKSLHEFSIGGVVDRDHKSDEEIHSLRGRGLRVVDVAEVENLFCIPAAVHAAAEQIKAPDPQAMVEQAKARVIAELGKALDFQIASRAIAEIKFKLTGFGPKASRANVSSIQTQLAAYAAGVDVAAIYKSATDLYNNVITNRDYEAALRFYNCKGITAFVSSVFGLSPRTYCSLVTGIVRSKEGADLANDLRSKIS